MDAIVSPEYEDRNADFYCDGKEFFWQDYEVEYPTYSGRDSFRWKEMSYYRYNQTSWDWEYSNYQSSSW
jgi:hypothetical protein